RDIDQSPQRAAPCRAGAGRARRPQHPLPRRLCAYERAVVLPHRKMLRRGHYFMRACVRAQTAQTTMKRFHVHVNVADLESSIGFYSTLFGSSPSMRKPDYAKWMLDDPRVNFAISQRERVTGVDHLGLQADDGAEL